MTEQWRRSLRGTLILAASVLLYLPASLAGAADGVQKIAEVEGITEYALDNGLQVLLFPDQSKPTLTVNITYHVGSRHEGRGESGMAHLLEHMVFKGTPSFPNIWGALEDHRASFNGTTWVDRTNYYETLPYSDENLDFALRMEADRMVNSLISGEELAKEMTVVRNEFEMGENSPAGVLSERMLSAAYLWHNYGKSTIGNRSDIERVPVDNLRNFYRKYYQPDNATLLVSGPIQSDQVLKLIRKYFASIPRPERVLEGTYTEEPAQDGPRMVTLNRVGDVATVGLVYHIPAGSDPEFAAVEILEDILTNQPSGHLYRRLVGSGIATSVSGSAFSWAEPGVMEFRAQVATDQQPTEVLAAMVDTIEGLAARGVSEEEVQRAVARSTKSYKLAMTNSGRIGIRLSESIALGDWRMLFIQRDRLEQVTASDVKQVAAKYLVESNRTAGMFLPTESPTRATVPSAPDVREMAANYQGRDDMAVGEVLQPDVDYLESRITRRVLDSGIKIALLPIERRGDSVQAAFKFHYGDEQILTGNTTAVGMIPGMLMRGTKRLDYEQLRNEIDRLESRISVGGRGGRRGGGGGLGAASAMIQSDREHILPSIKLLGEIMTQPAFDEEEFEIIKNRRLTRLEQNLSDPQALGMKAISRAMNPWPKDSIHYVPTMEETIERVEQVAIEDIRRLYEQLFGASYVEVAVVGDFDSDQVIAAIEGVFGSWKSPVPYDRIEQPFRPIARAESLNIVTPDKEMAVVAEGTSVAMRDDDPRYPALVLASYVLGESAKSRLMNRLRHEGGLSYGAGGGFAAPPQDDSASLMCMAICAPQNADKALSELKDVVAKWIDEGLSDEELEEAKNSYELKFKSSLGNESSLMSRMLSGLELDRTLHFNQRRMDAIQALTSEQIREALRATFGGATMVDLRAGDTARDAEPSPAAAADTHTDAKVGLPPMMARLDKNSDGKLQLVEAPGRLKPMFDRLDKNGDGAIDGPEAASMRPTEGKQFGARNRDATDGAR